MNTEPWHRQTDRHTHTHTQSDRHANGVSFDARCKVFRFKEGRKLQQRAGDGVSNLAVRLLQVQNEADEVGVNLKHVQKTKERKKPPKQ